jgi:hypothetical protein
MSQIFISYRREDRPEAAGRIYDRLKSHFGEKQVFFDIDSIPPGIDFREYIREYVAKCDVLIVIIGDRWIVKDDQGISRLENLSDFVRIEIEAALKRNIPVIPVPVGKAKVPALDDLPASIKDLHYRNAYEVRSGTSFEGHLQRLISGIEMSFQKTKTAPKRTKSKEKKGSPKRKPWKWALIGVVIVAIADIGFFVFQNMQQNEALKEFVITTSSTPKIVTAGEKVTLYVTVKGKNGAVIESANVTIRGSGMFLESSNAKYNPTSKLNGPNFTSGKTKQTGVFIAWWVCNPCALGYDMTVTVSRQGYKTNKIISSLKTSNRNKPAQVNNNLEVKASK